LFNGSDFIDSDTKGINNDKKNPFWVETLNIFKMDKGLWKEKV